MKRIIEIQIRLIIGTVAMWFAGSLIFGANLTSYGVTHVIRMGFYIEGALLVITLVGWPLVGIELMKNFVNWLVTINGQYNPITRKKKEAEDFVQEVEKALVNQPLEAMNVAERLINNVNTVGEDDTKWAWILNQFYDLFDVARTIMNHKPNKPLTEEEAKCFIPTIIEEVTYAKTWRKADGSPGITSTVTIDAPTLE